MSEDPSTAVPRSPFEDLRAGQSPNAAGQIGAHLQAGMLPSVTQVSTWISGVAGLEQALTALLGQRPPTRPGHTLASALGLLVRTGPEEFLLVSDQPADNTTALRRHVAADVGAVTDLSHARCRIRLHGERWRDTLSKLFPLDLRDAAFPVGEARLTGHHHVPAILHRTGPDQVDMYVFTTYAHDQLHALSDAALEYGISLAA